MNIKVNKLLIFISSILIIGFLILFDPRGNIVTEPFTQTISSISIAISYLIYDVDGFLGLREVYETINQIPHSRDVLGSRNYSFLGGSILEVGNIGEIKEYSKIIEEKIFQSKNLAILNTDDVHVFFSDIGYVFYIILSFLLFGVKLKSLSLLFFVTITLSSFIFLINFYKNNAYFLLLQTVLFSLVVVIIGNYGGSIQIASVTNYMFLSILSFIPTLHLSILFFEKFNCSAKSIFSIIIQLSLLIFLCFVRGTAMWGFLFLIFIYTIRIFAFGIKNFKREKLSIFSMISVLALFLIGFNLGNFFIKQNLSDDYKHESVRIKHPYWHSLFLGVSMHPDIHEKYVCSYNELEELKDIFRVKNIPCGIYPKLFSEKSKLVRDVIYYQPEDTFAYSAAIKYLDDRGGSEQIGITNNKNLELSLDFDKYEEILKILYFEIIRNQPQNFIYIHFIVKPLKFIFEFFKFGYGFLNSFKINSFFILVIFSLSLLLQFYSVSKIEIKDNLNKTRNLYQKYSIKLFFLIMLIVAALPSLVFYPSPQSEISTGIVILIILITYFFKKSLKK